MTALNFTVMQDKVADRRKCRTYRKAECIHEKTCGGYYDTECTDKGTGQSFVRPPLCYLICPRYEYRFKKGTTIHAYTGLRQRKYCKNKVHTILLSCPSVDEEGKCHREIKCMHQGALLLRPDLPECTDTYPIKLKDITEGDARLDGLEPGYQKGVCENICGKGGFHHKRIECSYCTPLKKLERFTVKAYGDNPILQPIIWED